MPADTRLQWDLMPGYVGFIVGVTRAAGGWLHYTRLELELAPARSSSAAAAAPPLVEQPQQIVTKF